MKVISITPHDRDNTDKDVLLNLGNIVKSHAERRMFTNGSGETYFGMEAMDSDGYYINVIVTKRKENPSPYNTNLGKPYEQEGPK